MFTKILLILGMLGAMVSQNTNGANEKTNEATFSFGVWGDMPYQKSNDLDKIPALLHSINDEPLSFSMHLGDIKDGSSVCSNAVFDHIIKVFENMQAPLIYVPGDNEWTDCHRIDNGSYDPLERLQHLRKVMFSQYESFGQKKISLTHQTKINEPYFENTRFSHQGIMFIQFNIPGSNNNKVLNEQICLEKRSARNIINCDEANAEHENRNTANQRWLAAGFRQAKEMKLTGIVLSFHGDPGFDLPETPHIDESQAPDAIGYRKFMEQVVSESQNFKGEVLLIHGDRHFFKVDKPLSLYNNKLLKNFTRLGIFGSPDIHWVKVTVHPKRSSLFDIEPIIVSQKDS